MEKLKINRFGSLNCTGSHNLGNKKICADHGAIDGLAFPQIVIIKMESLTHMKWIVLQHKI